MNINGFSAFNYPQNFRQTTGVANQNPANTRVGTAADVKFTVDFSSVEISVEEVQTAAPTIEDVKMEFAAFLDSLQITQRGTAITVSVSDSAWEKMAADPEYKQKMMDLCKRDLCDPAWGVSVPSPAVTTIRIDADAEEEYLASGYGSAVAGMANTSNSFWTRRSERHQAALEDMQKLALERREMMDFIQQRVDQRKMRAGDSFTGGFTNAFTSRYIPAATSAAASIFGSGSYL
ncbi:MAG: hypothetical protein LIQ30_11505 [Planctomycetes bacterium]|nr:hypothetical protein [Planctomycetota bacterium]MCC8116550.1 hypothetical protein [Planctomycetota bacterium]MCD7898200.1 hypothetical protein [Planctomycetaceae bacterium]